MAILSVVLCSCTHSREQSTAVSSSVKSADFSAADVSILKKYSVEVTISPGKAQFQDIDGDAAFEEVIASLSPGEIVSIQLRKAGENFFNSFQALSLAYKQGELWIDGNSLSETKPLVMTQQWLQGKKYNDVYTHGNVKLQNAIITVELKQ